MFEGIASAENRLLPGEACGLVLEIGGRRLVDGVDLTLRPGAITVLMGPNGAGKSLLLRLLHGMIQPTVGTVRWAGRAPDEAVRRRQAMVFQRPVLLRRTVLANIDFALSLRGGGTPEQCHAILDHVGLADHAFRPARLLSGGEQQRLALARALALAPEVLFLDEPTASLDPASVLLIETIVREAHAAGTKIVFVTHDVGQARRLADEVVFIHRGRVREHTEASQFFDRPASRQAQDYLAGRIVL